VIPWYIFASIDRQNVLNGEKFVQKIISQWNVTYVLKDVNQK
jgi:hypothetical protein